MGDTAIHRNNDIQRRRQRRGPREIDQFRRAVGDPETLAGRAAGADLQADEGAARRREQRREPLDIHRATEIVRVPRIARPHHADPQRIVWKLAAEDGLPGSDQSLVRNQEAIRTGNGLGPRAEQAGQAHLVDP